MNTSHASSIAPALCLSMQAGHPTLMTTARAPHAELEVEVTVGQPSTKSTPAEPDEPQHIPPKLTPLKEHVTSRGRYLWETCEFRDEYTGKAYRTLRFTSARNEKRPLSITMGPHICWTALDATFEFLAEGLPPEEAADARALYRCLMRAMTARPRAPTEPAPPDVRAHADVQPTKRGHIDPRRLVPR